MSKEIIYTIVTDKKIRDLALKVNDKLKSGWQQLGGISAVINGRNDYLFSQEMVKHEDLVSIKIIDKEQGEL